MRIQKINISRTLKVTNTLKRVDTIPYNRNPIQKNGKNIVAAIIRSSMFVGQYIATNILDDKAFKVANEMIKKINQLFVRRIYCLYDRIWI